MIWIALLWSTLLTVVVSQPEERLGNAVCEAISNAISPASDVFYFGGRLFFAVSALVLTLVQLRPT